MLLHKNAFSGSDSSKESLDFYYRKVAVQLEKQRKNKDMLQELFMKITVIRSKNQEMENERKNINFGRGKGEVVTSGFDGMDSSGELDMGIGQDLVKQIDVAIANNNKSLQEHSYQNHSKNQQSISLSEFPAKKLFKKHKIYF